LKAYKEILSKYLPENSVDPVIGLFEDHPCHLKIVNERKTKHGDFKILPGRKYQITINYNLNKYRFLLTLIHELAHLVTYKEFRRVKPHGKEWKMEFQKLMLPFFSPEIFPEDLMKDLAHYMRNPKASTDTDINLSLSLKKYDADQGKTMIFEVPVNSRFIHDKRIFKKGIKRRTRHECTEVRSGKKYLFHQNAEVELLTE
jgi:hypothetical protein